MIKQVILIGCLAAGAAEARTVRPARLAPSPFADTEASTNVPCAFDLTSVKSYRLSVDFVATDSNNVVVAYGHDGDRDGCLALGERSLEIGWDCGTAFVRGLGGEAAPDVEAPDTNGVVRISLFVPIKRRKANPLWLYDRSWDLMNVTVRGTDAPTERIVHQTTQSGAMVIIR